MERPNIPQLVAFFAVLLVYVAARFWNLSASCLWFDEIFSVHAAEHSWSGMLNFVALDLIHPPLFYAVLKTWIALGGEALFWLRLLPVVFSMIAIVPFVLLCLELRVKTWPAIFALFLLAVNGPLIKYAQEVRMYSMLMCMSLTSMWLFARYLRSGKAIAVLTVVNILLVYSHYFGWLVIAAEIAAVTIANRERLKAAAVSFAVTAAAFVPWAVAVLNASSSGSGLKQNIGWMTRPGFLELATAFLNLVEPIYFRSTSIDPLSLYLTSVPIAIIALVCIAIALLKSRVPPASRTSVFIPLIFFAVPLGIAFAGSWLLPYSVWGTRHLIIVFAPFAIVFAGTMFDFSIGRAICIPFTLILSVVGSVLALTRESAPPIWCGYEPAAAAITASGSQSVFVFEDLAAYHLWFSTRERPERPTIVKVSGFAAMPEDPSYFLPRGFDEVSAQPQESITWPGDLWLVYRSQTYDTNSEPLRSFLERGYSVTAERVDDFGYAKLVTIRLTNSTRQ